MNFYVVQVAEIPEDCPSEFASIVTADGSRGAEVSNVGGHAAHYFFCPFGFKGVESSVPTIVVYNGENISVALATSS